jgi:diguanylate cyclase (GGDEF)-like protein
VAPAHEDLLPRDRRHLLRIGWPFVAIMAGSFAVLPVSSESPRLATTLAAAALNVAIVVVVALTPWRRVPALLFAVPPIAYLVVVALLRDAEGGATSGYGVLALLPVLWLALHGSRGELVACVSAVFLALAIPVLVEGAPDYPESDWRRAFLLTAVAAFGGFATHRLQHERSTLLEQVRRQALSDQLTSLPNRRAWEAELERAVARAERMHEPLWVAMLDLDRFKAFNDRYGHPTGDDLLREAAAAWLRAVRRSDFVARCGGEEFGVILPGCDEDEARAVVERLRRATPASQTISVGLAHREEGEVASAVVARADGALYAAKRGGRDRVEIYRSG